jgi:hypothetical protein
MGVDFYAHSVIGLEIDTDCLVKQEIVKAFDHNIDNQDIMYCSETGRKLWKTIEVPVEGYDYDGIGDYDIVTGTDGNVSVVALLKSSTGSSNGGNPHQLQPFSDGFQLTVEKHKMKRALEPYGIWDEERFGLHSILYCSY